MATAVRLPCTGFERQQLSLADPQVHPVAGSAISTHRVWPSLLQDGGVLFPTVPDKVKMRTRMDKAVPKNERETEKDEGRKNEAKDEDRKGEFKDESG